MTQEDTMDSWRDSLRLRLETEMPGDAASQVQRLGWIAFHVREYVERWLGFVEHPSVSSQPKEFAFDSGMYRVISVAAELMEEEMTNDVPSATQDQWRSFLRLYNLMRDTREPASRGQLLRLAEELEASLQSSK